MYKEILKEQLEKLQNWQRKTAFTSDELIRFSTMIQETAGKLQAVEDAESIPLEQPQKIEITLDGTKIAEALNAIPKEELLEDFSTEELVRELEKRGAANIHRTDDKNLFVFTGNFYTD